MAIVIRAFVSWLLALGWALQVSLGAVCLAFANFVVAWQSFTAQGFEQLPLRHVPLLGWWAEGFGVGDAPLAALYALMLTLAMNIAIVVTAKVSARALRCFFDRRQALRSEDPALHASAPDYLDHAVQLSVWMVILVVASVVIVRYDVAQFRLRYENLYTDTVDPGDFLNWAPDPVVRLGEFLVAFIRTAVWGYVGCVVAMAVAVEYAIGRAAENWQALHNAIESALERESADGSPIGSLESAEIALNESDVGSPLQGSAGKVGDIGTAPSGRTPIAPPPAPLPAAATMRDPERIIEVIVGPGRTQPFAAAEVRSDGERFVRDGSGRAWFLRAYWEEVTGSNGPREGSS